VRRDELSPNAARIHAVDDAILARTAFDDGAKARRQYRLPSA
jgi:hypothetical protein